MTEEELIRKMDLLGHCMYDLELAQEQFDYDHRELLLQITELKDQLKPIFLQRKQSMKSNTLEVIYRKGALRWDSKKLREYAKINPWLNDALKESEPTIAFARRDEGWDDDGR